MKVLKVLFILIAMLNITVYSVNADKVSCSKMVDDKNEVATVFALENEHGKEMSESDIIVYIKNSVEGYVSDGYGNIILVASASLINEENTAKLIDNIDVICISACTEIKSSRIIDDTLVVYTLDKAVITEDAVNKKEDDGEIKKSPEETLGSMLLLCFALIAVALIVFLVLKKKVKK